jgi:biopolymer transport protein ExbD
VKQLIVALVVVTATGCAQQRPWQLPQGYNQATVGTFAKKPVQPQAVSLERIESIQLSDRDCVKSDQWITDLQRQLQYRGLVDVNPEDLAENDRVYNAAVNARIWALRIGCNNPDRYKK